MRTNNFAAGLVAVALLCCAQASWALPVESGLLMRFNASDGPRNGGGSPAQDGQPVAQWDDLASGGGANHATATLGQRPAFVEQGIDVGLVFRPTVRFTNPAASGNTTSNSDFDQMTTNLAMPDNFTAFVVAKVNDTKPRAILGTSPVTSLPANRFNLFTEGGDLVFRSNGVTDTRTAISVGDFFIAAVYSGAAGQVDMEVFQGGSDSQNGHDTSFDGTFLHVSGPIGGSGRVFDGDMAEILLYDNALSDTDRQAVFEFLDEQWLQDVFVPEPSSGMLLLLGCTLLGKRRRRRRGLK